MRALLCKLILLPSVLKKKNGKEERGPRKKRRGRRGSRETQPRKPCGLSPLRARQSSRSFHYPSSPSFLPRPQLRRFFDPLTLAASLADQISSLEHFDPSERLGPNASKAEALNYLFSCFFFFFSRRLPFELEPSISLSRPPPPTSFSTPTSLLDSFLKERNGLFRTSSHHEGGIAGLAQPLDRRERKANRRRKAALLAPSPSDQRRRCRRPPPAAARDEGEAPLLSGLDALPVRRPAHRGGGLPVAFRARGAAAVPDELPGRGDLR